MPHRPSPPHWILQLAILSALLGFPPPAAHAIRPAATDAEATIVFYSYNVPESEEIARYYAAKRGIPKANVYGLECPARQEIKRADFETTIRGPIRDFVREYDFIRYGRVVRWDAEGDMLGATDSALKYIVLCYGIPLKIAEDPKLPVPPDLPSNSAKFRANAAAVDSEIALLPCPEIPAASFIPNPLFNKTFNREVRLRMVCVARLDGPTPGDVKQMIDRTMDAERLGLYGRAMFDMRGISQAKSAYQLGDQWIRESRELFDKAGWEVLGDENEATFPEDTDASQCAFYAGWYSENINGPFASEDFRFQPGAIAYHLQSWSAKSLRSTSQYWTGPFISRGVSGTLGAVYEPYLQLTPHISILFDRLLKGATFGEAAYSCQEFISWMTTVVGDPLYRPFGIPLDERITRFESHFDQLDDAELDALAWAYRLKTRQMYLKGETRQAIELASQQAVRLQRQTLWVGLANLHLLNKEDKFASQAIQSANVFSNDPMQSISTLRFAARTCAQAQDWEPALQFYKALLTGFPQIPDYARLKVEAEKTAIFAKNSPMAQFFKNLKPPTETTESSTAP